MSMIRHCRKTATISQCSSCLGGSSRNLHHEQKHGQQQRQQWQQYQQHQRHQRQQTIMGVQGLRNFEATTTMTTFRTYSSSAKLSFSSYFAERAVPSYRVFGETSALTVGVVAPQFRMVSENMKVLDGKKRGRLLLQWTPKNEQNRAFAWDRRLSIGLTAEEAGYIITSIDSNKPVQIIRRGQVERDYDFPGASASMDNETSSGNGIMENGKTSLPVKVFRAHRLPNGSVKFFVDVELNGQGGQEPLSANEAKGPMAIDLSIGDYQVVRSIFEYSIPRLVGWTTLLDHAIEQSYNRTDDFFPSPHNYGGGYGGNNELPF